MATLCIVLDITSTLTGTNAFMDHLNGIVGRWLVDVDGQLHRPRCEEEGMVTITGTLDNACSPLIHRSMTKARQLNEVQQAITLPVKIGCGVNGKDGVIASISFDSESAKILNLDELSLPFPQSTEMH